MSTKEKQAPQTSAELFTRKVLIADSNHSRFQALCRELEASKFLVRLSNDRQKVLDMAIDLQPDIVVINLFLGSASTLSLIRELRGALKKRDTKILVLTSHYSKQNIQECVRSGASDCILDPFDTKLLLERIRYQLQDRESYSPDDLRSEPKQLLAGFQLVYECLKIIAEIKDMHRSLHEVLKRVGDLADSQRINIILGDLDTNKGIVVASSDDPNLQDLVVNLEKYNEVREVLINNNIVYIKDITSNPLTKEIRENVKSMDISSLLVLPIRHRADTIGVMSIRLRKDALNVTDKHLRSFYMVSLSLASKVAAKRLLTKFKHPAANPESL